MKVKDSSQVKKAFEDGSSKASSNYEVGIKGASWQAAASSDSAEDAYRKGVEKAISRKARANGVKKVSDASWKENSVKKGAAVIGSRMREASGKYAEGIAPYLDVLKSMELPERSDDVVANVMNRVAPIAKALADKKEAIQSGTK